MAALIRLAEPWDGPALAGIYRPAVTDNATSFELDPPDASPPPPRALGECRDEPAFAAALETGMEQLSAR
ncbi:MAG: hypothetical protein NUW01_15315 [Gemmatimonadaceae bacterium]|nr:hypothetical protein [Gemmatimonadaceae bacterium]